MDDLTGTSVFFDIGDTLASVTLAPAGDRIDRLAVYPYVPGVLAELRDRGARLGIISDRGPIPAEEVDRALEAAGLRDALRARAGASTAARTPPRSSSRRPRGRRGSGRVLFVGEDPGERAQALRAGFSGRAAPAAGRAGARGAGRRCATSGSRFRRPRRRRLARRAARPAGAARCTSRARRGMHGLRDRDDGGRGPARRPRLPGGPPRRRGRAAHHRPLPAAGRPAAPQRLPQPGGQLRRRSSDEVPPPAVCSPRPTRACSSPSPAGASVEDYHFRGAQHGHNLKLAPSPGLLEPCRPTGSPPVRAAEAGRPAVAAAIDAPAEGDPRRPGPAGAPRRARGAVLRGPAGGHRGRRDHQPAHPAPGQRRRRRRAGRRPGADRRADASPSAGTGSRHEGRRLDNVEAELAGTGLDGVVLVTAHLDSTAARQPGYRPALDPAPGADDDASGTAAVLAAADAIAALDAALGTPRRTVRFVLFNAEEHGLVGQPGLRAGPGRPRTRRSSAVLQMDMIGYDVLPERTFELHAGFTPRPRSRRVARPRPDRSPSSLPQVSPDLPAPADLPRRRRARPGRAPQRPLQLPASRATRPASPRRISSPAPAPTRRPRR